MRCPAFRPGKPDDVTDKAGRNTSLPPSSKVTKPKPFASLKNLTVPLGMTVLTEFPESPAWAAGTFRLWDILIFFAVGRDPAQTESRAAFSADLAAKRPIIRSAHMQRSGFSKPNDTAHINTLPTRLQITFGRSRLAQIAICRINLRNGTGFARDRRRQCIPHLGIQSQHGIGPCPLHTKPRRALEKEVQSCLGTGCKNRFVLQFSLEFGLQSRIAGRHVARQIYQYARLAIFLDLEDRAQ